MEGLSEGYFATWEVHFPGQCPAKGSIGGTYGKIEEITDVSSV
jgi:hypothetical protein